jgi:hypothetical protein
VSRGQARTPLLDQALKYAGRGLAVLPVNPDTKAPLNSNGCHGATSDPGTLVRWFQDQFPRAGIGIATGARRGPVVIDVDPRNRGEEGLRQAVDRLGPLPPCPTASSPSGGPHFYLDPGDEPVPCSAGKLGAGVDVRSTSVATADTSSHRRRAARAVRGAGRLSGCRSPSCPPHGGAR